jgi:hypothetical protein
MAISNEQLLALIKKNPVVTGALLLCVLLMVAIYLRLDAMPAAAEELEAKATEGKRLAENIKNSVQLTEQLAEVTAANQEIDSRLVRAGQLASNLQYFYRLEADTGTKLLDLRQGATPRAATSGKIPVSYNVSVQGSYRQVFEFLRRLESGTHYCRIQTASIVPLDDSGGLGLIRPTSARLTLGLELLGTP